jgi:large conductance mechanosensitive channel
VRRPYCQAYPRAAQPRIHVAYFYPRNSPKTAPEMPLEKNMLKGFRDFILRGNVVDLAVAVIIGAAFNAIVNSLVKDVLTQFIAAIVGKPDFSAVVVRINGTPIYLGNFLNATLSFLIVAGVVYFCIVLPLNTLISRLKSPATAPESTTKDCPECLSQIPLSARRCAHCGQPVA